jgi:hypothetical protein
MRSPASSWVLGQHHANVCGYVRTKQLAASTLRRPSRPATPSAQSRSLLAATASATFRSPGIKLRTWSAGRFVPERSRRLCINRQPGALAPCRAGPASGELRALGGSPGRTRRDRFCPRAAAFESGVGVDIVAALQQMRQRSPRLGRDRNDRRAEDRCSRELRSRSGGDLALSMGRAHAAGGR